LEQAAVDDRTGDGSRMADRSKYKIHRYLRTTETPVVVEDNGTSRWCGGILVDDVLKVIVVQVCTDATDYDLKWLEAVAGAIRDGRRTPERDWSKFDWQRPNEHTIWSGLLHRPADPSHEPAPDLLVRCDDPDCDEYEEIHTTEDRRTAAFHERDRYGSGVILTRQGRKPWRVWVNSGEDLSIGASRRLAASLTKANKDATELNRKAAATR
jgi:hypothetical protein